MNINQFLVLYGCVIASMLVCRCVPLFVLKGRDLSPRIKEALGLIPSAAFAALVANDLVQPNTLATDFVAGILPFIAALPVILVAKKTNSLIWSAVVGMLAYAALLYFL